MQIQSPSFAKVAVKSIHKNKTKDDRVLERQSHCENWRRSGLSMNQYCQQTGIALSSLSKWVQESKMLLSSPMPAVVDKKLSVEIILTNGMRAQITGLTSVSELLSLMQEVSSCN